MGENVHRQLRWNLVTDTGEQVSMRHKYVFLILNEPREIRRIQQKILAQLIPSSDLEPICNWQIPNSNGLYCRVFSLLSEKGKVEDFNQIYQGSVYHDRNLRDSDEAGLSRYLERITRTMPVKS